MAQSQRRAMRRGSLNKVSSTKVSKHSSGYVFRKGRFADYPSAEKIAQRKRRQKRMDDPTMELNKHGNWVKIAIT